MSNSKLYIGSIDIKKLFELTKSGEISVDRLNKHGEEFKNGAVYLPISVWLNEEPDDFGNIMAVKVGRGEEVKHYIGNAKLFLRNEKKEAKQKLDENARNQAIRDDDDDGLPF